MSRPTPPRIYCIPASRAPVVAVFRRGPSRWAHVGRWDLAAGAYESGAWFRGRLFPRRSDLSPDGRHLSVFAHKPGADWEHGEAWVALSRLPWLTALHAFRTCGTWTRGWHFTEDGGCDDPSDVDLPIPWGLRATPAVQFAVERRRGWVESPGCPRRDASDAWDERRNVAMQKPRPGGGPLLRVESLGRPGGEFGAGQAVDGLRVRYALVSGEGTTWLDEVQWADWDPRGRLLAATRDGRLQARELRETGFAISFDEDLGRLAPEPVPAPEWAGTW